MLWWILFCVQVSRVDCALNCYLFSFFKSKLENRSNCAVFTIDYCEAVVAYMVTVAAICHLQHTDSCRRNLQMTQWCSHPVASDPGNTDMACFVNMLVQYWLQSYTARNCYLQSMYCANFSHAVKHLIIFVLYYYLWETSEPVEHATLDSVACVLSWASACNICTCSRQNTLMLNRTWTQGRLNG